MAADLPTHIFKSLIPTQDQLQILTVKQLHELHVKAQVATHNSMGYLSLADKLCQNVAEELFRRQRDHPSKRAWLVEFAKSWLKIARHVDGLRHVSASISLKI